MIQLRRLIVGTRPRRLSPDDGEISPQKSVSPCPGWVAKSIEQLVLGTFRTCSRWGAVQLWARWSCVHVAALVWLPSDGLTPTPAAGLSARAGWWARP